MVGFRRRTLVLGGEHQMENNSGGLQTEIDSCGLETDNESGGL